MPKAKDDQTAVEKPANDVSSYVVKDPEKFAQNLATVTEQAGMALAAYLKPREEGRTRDEMAESMAEIIKTLGNISEYWLSDPTRAMEAQQRLFGNYLELWGTSVRRWSGEADAKTVEPHASDRRFSHPDWEENPIFDFIKQVYLVTSQWAETMVAEAEVDEHTRHKADFYVKQITSALSPSNFLVTNPEVLKETFESNGENLVRGMKMLGEDLKAGEGTLKIRQSDHDRFKVGENLAMTPGKVLAQNDVCQVLQYEPTTEKVFKRPLLIVPPWINKFYILDLNPEKSFIKWAVDQGHTVFVISWINPDERQAEKSFEHYMKEGVLHAIDVVEQATGERSVNTIGYCVGGTLLAVTLAYCAAIKDSRIKSTTFLTTQVDFEHAGDLKVFVDETQIEALERSMQSHGFLHGSKMANAFNMLRPNDLIWPYVINNYLRGKDPFPFDLLYWNSDATRMPAANHSFYLRNCYLENKLSAGEMVIDGRKLDLGKIKVPIYNLATREDHIAPAKSVFKGSSCFGGPVKYVMSGSGHIAGVINPPAKNKYQFWTNGPVGGSFDEWKDSAEETPGSWWPDWQAWMQGHSKAKVPARPVDGGKIKPIESAPGSYVKVRA